MSDTQPDIGDLLNHIRNELIQADASRRGMGYDPLFRVSELEIELKVVLVDSSKANAGIDLKIVSFGGEEKYETQSIHTIRIKLNSLEADNPKDTSEVPVGLLQTDHGHDD